MTDRPNPQLSGLLEQAVPDDAPTLDPHAVAAAARRSRNRSRATVAGVAALAVVGGGVAWAALDRGGDDSGQVANDGTSAPYDAPDCPATLPELSDAASSVDSLEGLTSVRMCPDLAPYLMTDPPPVSEQKAILAGMDALIGDMSGFARQVADAEPFDPARCATIDVLNTRQSLQLTYADGQSTLLPTAACMPITVAGHELDGQFLGEAFLAALDHQRSTVAYTYHGTVPLTCGRGTTPSPARPGRDHIVAAVLCGTDAGDAVPFDDEQRDRLAAAWDSPTPVPPASPDTCRKDTSLQILVATDRGDVVRLLDDNCVYLTPELAWTDVDPMEGIAIPTTLEDLGVTP